MKKTILIAACLFFLANRLATALAAENASAGACYSIADQDQRTFCLAKAHKDPAICYGIQRSDLRAQCRAEVQK